MSLYKYSSSVNTNTYVYTNPVYKHCYLIDNHKPEEIVKTLKCNYNISLTLYVNDHILMWEQNLKYTLNKM